MKILAFDTSTAQGGVALVEGEAVLSERHWIRERSHSEFLTAEIEAVLSEAKIKAHDVNALAIGHGPGSFTGLRVAVNAAKSLGYALDLKTFVFDTNEILIEAVSRTDLPVLILINAQKNAFFAASYKHDGSAWVPTMALKLLEENELSHLLTSPFLCVGDGCLQLETAGLGLVSSSHFIRDANISDYPSATNLGKLASRRAKVSQPLVWNAVQALYIRQSGAEEKLREGAKR